MERPVHGSLLGPTSHCIVRDQFERIKSGDRFFYTNSHVFSHSQGPCTYDVHKHCRCSPLSFFVN